MFAMIVGIMWINSPLALDGLLYQGAASATQRKVRDHLHLLFTIKLAIDKCCQDFLLRTHLNRVSHPN